MSARLMADPGFRGQQHAGRPRAQGDLPLPPRAMAQSAQKGNRRRAWPRWTRPALKAALVGLPVIVLMAVAGSAWKRGSVAESGAAARSSLIDFSAAAGFSVAEVLVEGRSESEREAVLEALGIRRGDPILSFDLAEAKARLEQLPWVSGAAVERRLPGIVYVRLSERQPMAIWQHDRKFTVIDREGRPLADAVELARRGNKRIDTLPQVVGANAPQQVRGLLAALDEVPDIRPKVTSASWIGDRRWNLQLDSGVTIRLPEGAGLLPALQQLAELNATGKVLDRDIVAIDLRQPDKAVIQTSATAQLPGWEEDTKKKPGKKN